MCKDFDNLPKIFAVDFDGTLVEDKWPEIGEPNKKLFELLKRLRYEEGIKLILWTSRNYSKKYGDLLEEAVQFCQEQGLEFDAINENITEVLELVGEDTRKVYADVYLDDKNVSVTEPEQYWCYRLGVNWYKLMGYFPVFD